MTQAMIRDLKAKVSRLQEAITHLQSTIGVLEMPEEAVQTSQEERIVPRKKAAQKGRKRLSAAGRAAISAAAKKRWARYRRAGK